MKYLSAALVEIVDTAVVVFLMVHFSPWWILLTLLCSAPLSKLIKAELL